MQLVLKNFWVFSIGILVFIFFIIFQFDKNKAIPEQISNLLDSSSAIALAVLAFIGYFKYSQGNYKKEKYVHELSMLSKGDSESLDCALLIQFGGSGNNLKAMDSFIEKNHPSIAKISKGNFGDDRHIVTNQNIEELKDFILDIKGELHRYKTIHVFYGGACVGIAVIADLLSNSSNLLYYHYSNGTYEPWYYDAKSQLQQPIDENKPTI